MRIHTPPLQSRLRKPNWPMHAAAAGLHAALHSAGVPIDQGATFSFTCGPGPEQVIVTMGEPTTARSPAEWEHLVTAVVRKHYECHGAPQAPHVRVAVPPTFHRETAYEPMEDALWMRAQAAGVRSFFRGAAHTLASAVYRRAAEALPWRSRARMDAHIPVLAANAGQRIAAGLSDPTIQGVADAALPRVQDILQPGEVTELLVELRRASAAPLETLFDMYAAAYEARHRTDFPMVRKLCAAVFQLDFEISFAGHN